MANEKLTEQEATLAKRAGKGGRAFVLARRKTPGLTLLEYQTKTEAEGTEDLDVGTTAAAPVEAAPVPPTGPTSTEPTRVTGPGNTAAKTTAKKTTTRKA